MDPYRQKSSRGCVLKPWSKREKAHGALPQVVVPAIPPARGGDKSYTSARALAPDFFNIFIHFVQFQTARI
jgi:hypothetical protein